jgi:hypothetical protein
MSNIQVNNIVSGNNSLSFRLAAQDGSVFNGTDVYTDTYFSNNRKIAPNFNRETDLETATGIGFEKQYDYLLDFSEGKNPQQTEGIDHATTNKWVVSAIEQYTDYELTTRDKVIIENLIEYVDSTTDIAGSNETGAISLSNKDNGIDLNEAKFLFSIIEGLLNKNLFNSVTPASKESINEVRQTVLSSFNKDNVLDFIPSLDEDALFNDPTFNGIQFYSDNPKLQQNFDKKTDLETATGIGFDLQYDYLLDFSEGKNPQQTEGIDHATTNKWVVSAIEQYLGRKLTKNDMRFIDDLIKYVDNTVQTAATTTGASSLDSQDDGVDLNEAKYLFAIIEGLLKVNLFNSVAPASKENINEIRKTVLSSFNKNNLFNPVTPALKDTLFNNPTVAQGVKS